MFDDIEGLKKRAVEIQQERNQCEKVLNCQKDEIAELRHQLALRDDLIQQMEHHIDLTHTRHQEHQKDTLNSHSDLVAKLE